MRVALNLHSQMRNPLQKQVADRMGCRRRRGPRRSERVAGGGWGMFAESHVCANVRARCGSLPPPPTPTRARERRLEQRTWIRRGRIAARSEVHEPEAEEDEVDGGADEDDAERLSQLPAARRLRLELTRELELLPRHGARLGVGNDLNGSWLERERLREGLDCTLHWTREARPRKEARVGACILEIDRR